MRKPFCIISVTILTSSSWNLLRGKRIWTNYLDPNVCPIIKKALNLTQIIRKIHTSTSSLKRHYIRNPEVDLVLKTVTLVTITKVILLIKGTIAILIMGIKFIPIMVKVISIVTNSVAKRSLTQESYKYGCLEGRCLQSWTVTP